MKKLKRGVLPHTPKEHLRRPRRLSASDAEWERYIEAAQLRGMSISAFLRSLAEREIAGDKIDDARM